MAGGMAVMVDLNEYRRAVGAFKIGGGGMGGVSTNGTQVQQSHSICDRESFESRKKVIRVTETNLNHFNE